jgi:hypothetical protein
MESQMGKPAIVDKLNREFHANLATEAQVVYILVETRKLLEQQNTLATFPAVKLCCDWAVHPKLDWGARDVLKLFDDFEIEYVNKRAAIAPADFKPLHGFATLSNFRGELIDSLAPHGVDVQPLKSDDYWRSFVRLYTGVIQDCPLEAREGKTTYVTRVAGFAWPDDQIIFPGKLVIQWIWWLKDGRERETKETCALI